LLKVEGCRSFGVGGKEEDGLNRAGGLGHEGYQGTNNGTNIRNSSTDLAFESQTTVILPKIYPQKGLCNT
jgi:hypothetical protein